MFSPLSFLNRQLRLSRASICINHRSPAWFYTAMLEVPVSASLSADPSLSHPPSLSQDWNMQQTHPCQTPLSAPSVFCFLDLAFSQLSLLPSYRHHPFVSTCKSHKSCGFYALGQVSIFSASLVFCPPRANQGFPSGVQDLDACLTSVLSISKTLVRAWTVAIRIRVFVR